MRAVYTDLARAKTLAETGLSQIKRFALAADCWRLSDYIPTVTSLLSAGIGLTSLQSVTPEDFASLEECSDRAYFWRIAKSLKGVQTLAGTFDTALDALVETLTKISVILETEGVTGGIHLALRSNSIATRRALASVFDHWPCTCVPKPGGGQGGSQYPLWISLSVNFEVRNGKSIRKNMWHYLSR
jgi:hypothetical protein